MLIIYGAWWDDMLIWNVSPEFARQRYEIFNNPFVYYLRSAIFKIEDMHLMTFVCRLVPFICWYVSVSMFFLVIKIITNNKPYTLYTSLLVASCGLNKCMILLSCYHYTISIALFMIGMVFFLYDYYKSKVGYKILVSLFWTLSLLIWRSAILVVPAAIFFSVLSRMKIELKSKSFYLDFIKRVFYHYWIIIVGLLVFAILYKTILAPRGDYASYYSMSMKNLVLSPVTTLSSSVSLLLGYISNIFSVFAQGNENGFIMLVLLLALFIYLLRFTIKSSEDNKPKKTVLLASCLFLFFSMMPHLLREFSFLFDINGYKTRVAALAVFPISMISAYLLMAIKKVKYRTLLFSALVVLSIGYSVNTYLDYEKGWSKNEAIAKFFRVNDDLRGGDFVCIDNSQIYSPFRDEQYRLYDFEGCTRLAYGKYDTTAFYSLNGNNELNIIDKYLFIDTKEKINHIGIKSLVYRLLNSQKYDDLINRMLMFRIETDTDFNTRKK